MTVKAKLPGGTAIFCGAPSVEIYERYLDKLARDERSAAQRELVFSTCELEPEQLRPLLDRFPASVPRIAKAVDELAHPEGAAYTCDFESMTLAVTTPLHTLTINAPDFDAWEAYKEKAGSGRVAAITRELVRGLCTSEAEFDAVITRWPGVSAASAGYLHELLGGEVEIELKKG